VKVTGNWRSNNANVVREACEQGLGIAYMPESTFTESIEQQKLVPLLDSYCIKGATSWIVYQNKQFMPLRARLAIDFLLERFAKWN
jgi:DNA-binding transcriptional LysR family regulator